MVEIAVKELITKITLTRKTRFERRIERLFTVGRYYEVISEIEKAEVREPRVTNARYISLIKSACLMITGDTYGALKILTSFSPYDAIDEIDFAFLDCRVICYDILGFEYLKKREQYAIDYLKGIKEELLFNAIDMFNKYDITDIKLLTKTLIAFNCITEACLGIVILKKENALIDDELKTFMHFYPETEGYINELLTNCFYKSYIIVQNEEDYRGKLLYFLLERIGYETVCINISDIDRLAIDKSSNSVSLIFGLEQVLLELSTYPAFLHSTESVYQPNEKLNNDYYRCLIYGDYFSLMHFKYKYDYSDWDVMSYSCLFSIVIPVRGDGKYLYYAIESALNQTYSGDYEVLICDNSDPDDKAVKETVERFNDKRVRYIHTPQCLPLPKSFEYAYLSANGKYLLSFGSDDAIMPYTLEILYQAINLYSHIELFQWRNGGYIWGTREAKNMMIRYKQERFTLVDCGRQLEKVLSGNASYGSTPKLYLSCCFNRSLIQKFINITGKFEAGISQDVYTGLAGLNLLKEYLSIGVPLCISGTSKRSTGLASHRVPSTPEQISNQIKHYYADYRYNNDYYYPLNKITDLLEYCSFDVLMLYELLKIDKLIGIRNVKDETIRKFTQRIYMHYPQNYADQSLFFYHLRRVAEVEESADWFYKEISEDFSIRMKLKMFLRFHLKKSTIISDAISSVHRKKASKMEGIISTNIKVGNDYDIGILNAVESARRFLEEKGIV